MRAFNPRTIVIPTDFSATADHAFAAAQLLAARFASELVIVHCDLMLPPVEFGYPTAAYVASLATTETDLRERLQNYADERLAQGEVPYRVELVHDGPVIGITRTAEQIGADLIVIGTHGRTGWRRAVLGSVAEGVMRTTSTPVLTVRNELSTALTRILCPVNFTAAAKNALEYAASLALTLNAELMVVHVLELAHHLMVDEQPPLREWIPPEVRNRCRYAEFVERGDAAEEIIGFAERNDASLIVLGAQHKRFLDQSVVGVTSERVVRHATRPVLTIAAPIVEEDRPERVRTVVREERGRQVGV